MIASPGTVCYFPYILFFHLYVSNTKQTSCHILSLRILGEQQWVFLLVCYLARIAERPIAYHAMKISTPFHVLLMGIHVAYVMKRKRYGPSHHDCNPSYPFVIWRQGLLYLRN